MATDLPNETFKFEIDESKRPGLFVILAGLATTAITMFILFFLNKTEFNAMGFYVYFIIPVGAILVGLAAGSGYGIASYLTGAKIGKGLMLLVIILQVVAYFMAQYVEYMDAIRRVPENMRPSFMQYFDHLTQTFAFVGRNGKAGAALGMWGYGVRVLDIVGFAGGALIAPAVLFSVSYCERCQVYRKSQELGLLPAGVAPRKVKKKDVEGQAQYEEEINQALEAGLNLVEQIQESIEKSDIAVLRELLAQHNPDQKEIGKLTSRLSLTLQRCPRCNEGSLVVYMNAGQGENASKDPIVSLDLDAACVHGLTMKSP